MPTTTVQMVNNDHISALFCAAADAVEEAILNALLEALAAVGWKADPRAAQGA
ncbi:P1 family peptidase [Pseudomonas sp. UM16]|uniref:P1 family peptidase n=1 Tax=Pseudomonas sp. UM16 TaxID=3158962 RepID=UPI003990344E